MATVYLAVQESVDREVAVKVMSPFLLADTNFAERFVREARIAARLQHRNVVQVYDVGRHQDVLYIAMEYLSGGEVIGRDSQPIDVSEALRVIREVAGALAYAHSKGFIHRDVKPDNILLRSDRSTVLTDFGIARAADSQTHMTKTGSVIGTPYYMSPEQARGLEIDGRADIYSLGIVLHELLIGRVPFYASDSLAVGIMHITQPVPDLPGALAALNPLLQRMLAKDPKDRFQNGDEVVDIVLAFEEALESGELPGLVASRQTPRPRSMTPPRTSVTRIDAANTESRAATGARLEPQLGNLDYAAAVEDRPRPSRNQPPAMARKTPATAVAERATVEVAALSQGSRSWVWGVALAVALGTAGAVVWQWPAISALWAPAGAAAPLLVKAAAALDEGRLIDGAQPGAGSLYDAALKLEPDHPDALAGVEKTVAAALAAVDVEIEAGNFGQANKLLELARKLRPAEPALAALAARLESARLPAAERPKTVDELLLLIDHQLAEGNLVGSAPSAEATVAQARLVAPGDPRVEAKAAQLAGRVLDRALSLAAGSDRAGAQQLLDVVVVLTPANPRLEDLKSAVAQLDRSVSEQTRLATLIEAADNDRKARRYEAAAAKYREVLAADSSQARARSGLAAVAETLAGNVEKALRELELDRARPALERFEEVFPDDRRAVGLRSRLDALDASSRAAELSVEQIAERDQYLVRARGFMAAEQLYDPPFDNAYDQYSGALRIDRNNAEALSGLVQVRDKAAEMVIGALAKGDFEAAERNLTRLRQAAGGAVAWAERRSRVEATLVQLVRDAPADQRADLVARARAWAVRNVADFAPPADW